MITKGSKIKKPYLSRSHNKTLPSLAHETIQGADVSKSRVALGWKMIAPTLSLWPKIKPVRAESHFVKNERKSQGT